MITADGTSSAQQQQPDHPEWRGKGPTMGAMLVQLGLEAAPGLVAGK